MTYAVYGRVRATSKQKAASFGWLLVATSGCILRVGKSTNQTEATKKIVWKYGQKHRTPLFTGMTIDAARPLIISVCSKVSMVALNL